MQLAISYVLAIFRIFSSSAFSPYLRNMLVRDPCVYFSTYRLELDCGTSGAKDCCQDFCIGLGIVILIGCVFSCLLHLFGIAG